MILTYGNAEDFISYIESRGKKISADLTAKIDSALLVASEWLDGRFETIWIGYKTDGFKQERSWPRLNAIVQSYPYYVYGKDEIPEQVKKATYEAAFRELQKQGSLQVDFKPNQYQTVSVPGAVSVTYNNMVASASEVQIEIPIIETLMLPLIDEEKTATSSVLSGSVTRV